MRLSPILTVALLLTACCTDPNSPDCTAAEKADLAAAKVPQLIAEQDGVRVYRFRDPHRQDVYFTTPCGDVAWSETRPSGKTRITIPHQVNGIGCR